MFASSELVMLIQDDDAAPKDDSNPVPYSAELHASSQRMKA